MRRLSWIIWAGSGLSGQALAMTSVPVRERQEEIRHTEKRRQCEHGGRNQSDMATSQGMSKSPEGEKSMEWILHQSLQSQRGPVGHFSISTSGLLNFKRIHFLLF